jgi:hypothetical protein
MAVEFDLGDGTDVRINDNSQLVKTQRGMIAADQVVQGDKILYVSGLEMAEITSVPVVT